MAGPAAMRSAKAAPAKKKRNIPGTEKAAIFLLSLSDEYLGKIMESLDETEILELSQIMSNLGKVKADEVEELYVEFANNTGSAGSLTGSLEGTERMLKKFFDDEKTGRIMEEIRGPAGRTMWEKLSNVSEEVLTAYLKNEYPQTAAVVLSKIKPAHAAKVFSLLPENLSLDIMMRMLKMDMVQKEILDDVEKTLRAEFMNNLVRTNQVDPYEQIAEVFNSFDRTSEAKFMEALEKESEESAEKVRSLMFTFDDLIKLDATGIQTVIRLVDGSKLAYALKGANDDMKDLFFKNMSERAAKMMKEEMEEMGMVKLKVVDEAQLEVVTQVKEAIDRGEIEILEGGDDDELVG